MFRLRISLQVSGLKPVGQTEVPEMDIYAIEKPTNSVNNNNKNVIPA
jgi:hypothetical protein